jgi:hypothetical protein
LKTLDFDSDETMDLTIKRGQRESESGLSDQSIESFAP